MMCLCKRLRKCLCWFKLVFFCNCNQEFWDLSAKLGLLPVLDLRFHMKLVTCGVILLQR